MVTTASFVSQTVCSNFPPTESGGVEYVPSFGGASPCSAGLRYVTANLVPPWPAPIFNVPLPYPEYVGASSPIGRPWVYVPLTLQALWDVFFNCNSFHKAP